MRESSSVLTNGYAKEPEMPVSKADVVDGIVVDRESDAVILAMYEERDWSQTKQQLHDLESKINKYIEFIHGGQIDQYPEYRGKRRQIELYCQCVPSEEAAPVLQEITEHLAQQQTEFRVFIGVDRSFPMSLSRDEHSGSTPLQD